MTNNSHVSKLLKRLINKPRVKLSGFSEACYNQNSAEELFYELSEKNNGIRDQSTNKTDRKTWGLSRNEWIDHIENALAEKYRDFLEKNNCESIGKINHSWDRTKIKKEHKIINFLGLNHFIKKD